jgi:hypothetical protein
MMNSISGGKKRELHGFMIIESINWAGWCYCSEEDNPDLNPIKRYYIYLYFYICVYIYVYMHGFIYITLVVII